MAEEKSIEVTSPFKGICEWCKKRTIVRNYPYNELERLGTLCYQCFSEFDKAMEEYKDYYEDEE